jgi:lysophospholipase L1-like esterase
MNQRTKGLAQFLAGAATAGVLAVGLHLVRQWQSLPPRGQPGGGDAAIPEPYIATHLAILERERRGPVGVLFLGDSITHGWRDVPWIWDEAFGKYNPCNAGVIFDRVQTVRWRIEHGELDGIDPQVIVLQIGINNFGLGHETPRMVAEEIAGLAADIHARLPRGKVVVLGIFPAIGDQAAKVAETNAVLRPLLTFPNVGFYQIDGSMSAADFPDGIHPSPDGYRKLAKALVQIINTMYYAASGRPPHP